MTEPAQLDLFGPDVVLEIWREASISRAGVVRYPGPKGVVIGEARRKIVVFDGNPTRLWVAKRRGKTIAMSGRRRDVVVALIRTRRS